MAGTIITNIGAAKVANAVALGTQVQLTEMAAATRTTTCSPSLSSTV